MAGHGYAHSIGYNELEQENMRLRTQLAEEKKRVGRMEEAIIEWCEADTELERNYAPSTRDRARTADHQLYAIASQIETAAEGGGQIMTTGKSEGERILINPMAIEAVEEDYKSLKPKDKELVDLLGKYITAEQEGEPLNGMEMTLACEEGLKKSYHPGQEEHTHE